MKYELHVPIEQYGFVSGVLETEDVSEVRTAYERIHAAFAEKPQNTLPDSEMTDFIYGMLNKVPYHVETWEHMNDAQKTFINQLKKAMVRKPKLATNE